MSEPTTIVDPLENLDTDVSPEIPTSGYAPNFQEGNTQPIISAPQGPQPIPVDEEPEPAPVVKEELKPEEVLNKITPNVEPVEITLSWEGHDEVFTQRPLTYFRKIEFFGLVGRTIEELVNGPDAVNIDAIFGDLAPTSVDDIRGSDLGELGTFIAAVAKLASYAPDFMKEAYLIILNVPYNKKAFAREALDYIDDDTGEEIIVRFVDQNYKELESFFTERLRKVLDHVQALRSQS